jgi:iron complex transport system permease protein
VSSFGGPPAPASASATAAAPSEGETAPSVALERRRRARAWATGVLAVVLTVTLIVAAGVGAMHIAPGRVVAIVLHALGLSSAQPFAPQEATVLLQIRAPRVVLAALVGSTLGTSGVAMQGLLRNPLADAALLGVSSGGALAAALCIVMGGAWLASGPLGGVALSVFAFAGGLVSAIAVLRLGRADGKPSISKVLLAGIGINALVGAALGWLTYVADEAELRTLTFWTLGGFGGARWSVVFAGAVPLLACAIGVPLFSRALNVLSLGERDARHLGLRVDLVTRALVALVALGVGAAVAASGVIGFVGLVVPHLLRMALGPDHRGLAAPSALLGAIMLVGADTLARTVAAPSEMPVGVVTAAAGAPVFLFLLIRDKRFGSA